MQLTNLLKDTKKEEFLVLNQKFTIRESVSVVVEDTQISSEVNITFLLKNMKILVESLGIRVSLFL